VNSETAKTSILFEYNSTGKVDAVYPNGFSDESTDIERLIAGILVWVGDHYENKMKNQFDAELSRKIDCIRYLIGN